MDQLTKHIKGLAKAAEKELKNIALPEDATEEQKELFKQAQNAFDLSGDMKQKQQQLNNLFNALANYR